MSQLENIINTKKGKHLIFDERKEIEKMLRIGVSIRKIAKELCRNESTIKREIKRGTIVEFKANKYLSKDPNYPTSVERKVYYAKEGQRNYELHRLNCGNKSKLLCCKESVKYVEKEIRSGAKRSPDSAIGYAKANNLFQGEEFCTKTFYSWVKAGLVNVNVFDLLLVIRREPDKKAIKRKKKLGKSIDLRPSIVETREEFGHWEGDLIVGKEQKTFIFTLVERKTRIGLAFKIPNRESINIVDVIDKLEKRYGEHFKKIFKSITFDNGSEFSDSAGMEKDDRLKVYYAHPYSSYERGTNENWNGIVRRYIPKGSSFEYLTDKDIERIVYYINTLPRKRIGYKTPLDLWNKEISAMVA